VSKTHMGGTMRLGARKTLFSQPDSTLARLYHLLKATVGTEDVIIERHRHRYEVNPEIVPILSQAGMRFVGQDESGQRQEIIELPRSAHPYYVGVQYHPEMKSRPMRATAPFVGLLLAATGKLEQFLQFAQAPPLFDNPTNGSGST